MKSIILIICFTTAAFCAQKYYHLDSLPFGTGIDLDSGTVKSTNPFLRQNPYLRTSGSFFDSTAQYDISWTEMGLLWCFCDEYNLASYFHGFYLRKQQEEISRLSAGDTLDTGIVKPLIPFIDSIYRCSSNPDGSLTYLLKTNKKNWSVVKIKRYLREWRVICDPPPQNCVMRVEIAWWVQDDGSLRFDDLTPIWAGSYRSRTSKQSAPIGIPVNLKGQVMKNSSKMSAFERIKRGIIKKKQ